MYYILIILLCSIWTGHILRIQNTRLVKVYLKSIALVWNNTLGRWLCPVALGQCWQNAPSNSQLECTLLPEPLGKIKTAY